MAYFLFGFYIYKNSSYKGHAMKDPIEKLKRQYKIKQFIVVAGGGMLNKDNLSLSPHDENGPGIMNILSATR